MPSYITRKKARPINFATKSAKARVSATTIERAYNCFAEAQEQGATTPASMIGVPGMNPVTTLPADDDRRIRGLEFFQNQRLFSVTDSHFYEVLEGTAVDIGNVIVRGRASTANNGDSVVFVDGFKGYYWTEDGGLEELTAEGFYPSNAVAFIDGFYIFNRRGTGQFFIARGNTFDPTEFATAEGAPDDTITLLVDHRQIWLFGETSIEIWYNSGAADFPFERLQGAFIEKGIAGPQLATKSNNTVYWVGHDRIVYQANGYQPIRISTHALEFVLAKEESLENATLYSYTQEGHLFLGLNLKDITWCFDVSTGRWHERGTDQYGRYPADVIAKNNGIDIQIDGKPVAGHFNEPLIASLDLDYGLVGDELLLRECITPPIFDRTNRMKHPSFELLMDVPTVREAPAEDACCNLPAWTEEEYISVAWTSDKGKSFTHEDRQPYGEWGIPDERIWWWKLGSDYIRSYRIRARTRGRFGIAGGFIR